jgi:hypothetical protein
VAIPRLKLEDLHPDPDFGVTSVSYDLAELVARASKPF